MKDAFKYSTQAFYLASVAMATLLGLHLQGCVYATYNAEEGNEALRIISLLKEVDGFSADRIGAEFSIEIDKTRGDDLFENLAELLESLAQLEAMGLSYTPTVKVPYRLDEPTVTD